MSYDKLLPDRRLGDRANRLVAALTALRTVSIAQLARTWAEQMAYYRLLSNQRVSIDRLTEGLFTWMKTIDWRQKLSAPSDRGPTDLLVIQDTTEVSFERHRGRLQPDGHLGWLSNNRQHGYCLHPALVVEAHSGFALGFGALHLWARPIEAPRKGERRYRDLPIEQKESFRWIEALAATARRLGPGVRLTTVGDREADIYSLFARLPDGCGAIVRVCRNRRIEQAPGHLYEFLQHQPRGGTETIWVRGDLRRGRQGRWAGLTYRFAPVTLRRPERSSKPDARGTRDPRLLRLWALEVREEDPPPGAETICWRLLTTHAVDNFAQARHISGCYRQRWHLEQVFRLLKRDGLDLEASELESGEGLKRLGVLTLGAALDVLRLLLAERGATGEADRSDQPLGQVFAADQQACLAELTAELEGQTVKQQNPHPPDTLAWAAWIIARLGGWKGYHSQHRAGPATYHRGLERFHTIYEGWQLAHRQDVYKP